MQIREFCDIEAKGRSPYPFINAVRNSAISCTNQYCKGETFFCQVLRKDLPELEKIAERCHVTLTVQQKPSLTAKLKKYRFRFGIPVGILMSIGILFYYSNVVTVIEIQGNETVPESVILSQLEQDGLKQGAWIADLDTARCETNLRIKIPKIAWAGIRNNGNRLVIQVTEETPQIEMLHERTPCHVVARYDAQITNVRVYSGQLQRLIRDGVAAGDIIVSGIIQDEVSGVHYRHALAEITGIYTKETEISEYFQVAETVRTGRSVHQQWFQIFNLRIPLSLRRPDFTESSQKEFYTPFCFLNHTLPCGIFQKITTETLTSVITRTQEETELALNTAIVRYEKNFLSDVNILDRHAEYITDETGMSCRLTYTVEGEIGMTSEFFIPKTDTQPETQEKTEAEQ